MSETLNALRRQSKELSNLLKDIQVAIRDSNSLIAEITAPHTLGPDVKVQKWALLEHFLITYMEWNQLYSRYLEYFGQSDSHFPKSWRNLRFNCDQSRIAILTGAAFEELPDIINEQLQKNEGPGEPSDPIEWFHEIIQNGVSRRFTDLHSWEPVKPPQPKTKNLNQSSYLSVLPKKEKVKRALEILDESDLRYAIAEKWRGIGRELDNHKQLLHTKFNDTDNNTQADVDLFLRNYRHATLSVSWLEQSKQNNSPRLFMFDRGSESRMPIYGDFLRRIENVELPSDQYQVVQQVLNRITNAICEIGYGNFAKDITAQDFKGGSQSPLGSDAINLIPGEGTGMCCPTLVAVSQGSSKRSKLGFHKIMQQVKIHLTNCVGTTRVVIVLCDSWDASSFMDEHFHELQAHHNKGVEFIFLASGAPDTSLSLVNISF